MVPVFVNNKGACCLSVWRLGHWDALQQDELECEVDRVETAFARCDQLRGNEAGKILQPTSVECKHEPWVSL